MMKNPLGRWSRPWVVAVVAWSGTAAAQQVEFRAPAGGPDSNSDVIRSAAFSPDGTLLAAGFGRFTGMLQDARPGVAVLWDAKTGRQVARVAAEADGVCAVEFAPGGALLAVAEYPGVVRLCEVPGGRVVRTIKAPAPIAGAIAFSPDGKRLAAGLWAGDEGGNDVAVWDAATGAPALTLKGHADAVHALAFSPDGKTLLSGGADGTLRAWEAADGKPRATLEFPDLAQRLGTPGLVGVYAVAFAPDGRTFATSAGAPATRRRRDGEGEVALWDAATRERLGTLEGEPGLVRHLAFSPDGSSLATASGDGTVRLWDVATRRGIAATRGGPPLEFSPDGKELVMDGGAGGLVARKVADAPRR